MWLAAAWVALTASASADEDVGEPVLDTSGFWRVHYTMRLPVLLREGKLVGLVDVAKHRYVSPPEWIRHPTAFPPTDWYKDDFDDSSWERLSGTLVTTMTYWQKDTDSKSPFTALVCARGKFAVTDPSRAAGLTLEVEYRGGVVVYLNGIEIARQHLPKARARRRRAGSPARSRRSPCAGAPTSSPSPSTALPCARTKSSSTPRSGRRASPCRGPRAQSRRSV